MKRILLAVLALAWVAGASPSGAAESGADSTQVKAEKPADQGTKKPARPAGVKTTSERGASAKTVSSKAGVKGSSDHAAADKSLPAKDASGKDAKTPTVVDSLELLERAVAKDSSKFDNLYRLGVMYLDRDRIPEATRVLFKATRLKPKDVPALVNLGAAHDAAGASNDAQRFYREALEVSPDDSIATCRLASSLYAQSKYSESMDLLRGLIASRPRAYCAYFYLGVAFADAGIYRDAIRMWKKVVELAPNSPEAASATESSDVLEKFIKSSQ